MVKIFRNARRHLFSGQRVTDYLLYATGEIVLVVIGILIALQVNDWSDRRHVRSREMQYLRNIRTDLVNNIATIDTFITSRSQAIADANVIVGHIEGEPILDMAAFNRRCVGIYNWKRFVQINFTVEELISSGNLALISNNAIKSALLRLESAAKANKSEEDHFRFDAEELLYKPVYEHLDLHPMLRSYGGEPGALSPGYFDIYQTRPRFKNGFLIAILEFTVLNEQLAKMKETCEELIGEIDRELSTGG